MEISISQHVNFKYNVYLTVVKLVMTNRDENN